MFSQVKKYHVFTGIVQHGYSFSSLKKRIVNADTPLFAPVHCIFQLARTVDSLGQGDSRNILGGVPPENLGLGCAT